MIIISFMWIIIGFIIIFICGKLQIFYIYLTATQYSNINRTRLLNRYRDNLEKLYLNDWSEYLDQNHLNTNPTKETSCCICLDECNIEKKIVSFEQCGKIPHLFCKDCILEYGNTIINSNEYELNIKCPICQTTVWSICDNV